MSRDPNPDVVALLAAVFADAHAQEYSLVHGHLRWAATDALAAVDIPDEADLADLDQARSIGWNAEHGRFP